MAQIKKGERISNNYVFTFVFRARGQGYKKNFAKFYNKPKSDNS